MIEEVERYVVFYNHYRIHIKFEDVPMNVRKKGTGVTKALHIWWTLKVEGKLNIVDTAILRTCRH